MKKLIILAFILVGFASCTKTSDTLNPVQVPCDPITRNMAVANLTKDTVYPGEHVVFMNISGKHYMSRKHSTFPYIYTPLSGSPYYRYSYDLGVPSNYDIAVTWGTLRTATYTIFNYGTVKFTDIRDSVMSDTLVYNIYTMQNVSIGNDTTKGWAVWIKDYIQY